LLIVFTTNLDKLKVIVDLEEIAELFASSFRKEKIDENKKDCFLNFTRENQIKWCENNIKKCNINLLNTAKIINGTGEVNKPQHQSI